MAHLANDGTPFTNLPMAKHHNTRLAAGTVQPMKKPAMQPGGGKNIEDDPVAMRAVETLKRLGYTGEEVEQAMGGSEDDDNGQEAAGAASMQIPGGQ